MGLLDRFRAQPTWQDPDPSVRAAAVHEIPDEDQELLCALAREDPDPRVRRTAVRRLVLADRVMGIAREDQDEQVRCEARGVLLRLVRDSSDDDTALAALAALGDPRDLADLAKTATLEAISYAALAGLSDVRALGSVARRSRHSGVRREALARIDAVDELVSVAQKTEDKEIGLAALERVLQARPDDRETLAGLAVRARNRFLARRARAALRAIEGSSSDDRTAALAREERLRVCAEVERLVGDSDAAHLGAALDEARRRWADLADEEAAPLVDEATAERFGAACQAAARRQAELEAEQAARARQVEEHARALSARAVLCERVDAVEGDEALQKLEELRLAWDALPALSGGDVEAMTRRFTKACEACRMRHERWQASRAAISEFERLIAAAAQAVESPDLNQARSAWHDMERAWAELARTNAPGADHMARFRAVGDRLRARGEEERAARLRAQQQNAARIATLCDRLETLARSDRLTLREADAGLREARAALEATGPLPRRERDQLVSRVRSVHAMLTGRVRELRDLQEWQKWANLGVQEELCREVEALVDTNDLPRLARQLRDLIDRWKKVSAGPKEQADALWRRFKTAYDVVHARCEKFLAEQAARQIGHLRLKEALCAQAEALADSTEWVQTAQHFERLQAEWKTIGAVPREHAAAIWHRFRSACDRFYTRRKADLARRKEEWARNLERKNALCTRAEALAESTEWEQAAAEIRRLQAEWRTVGSVKKNKSEIVWQRFRSACDRFFERYHQRDQIALAGKIAERDQILGDLAALLPETPGAEAPPDVVERVTVARTRWRQAAPLPSAEEERQRGRFADAIARLVEAYPAQFRRTELDPDLSRRKMEKLCARVEALVPADSLADGHAASPAELLARRWREVLAAKQLGVRVDEEAKWREIAEEVRRARAAWQRLGPVPGDAGRVLADRFQRACRHILDRRPRPRHSSAAQPAK